MRRSRFVALFIAVVLAIAAAVLGLVFTEEIAHGDIGRRDTRRRPSDPTTFIPLRRQPLVFEHACDPGDVVTLGFFGDVLVHDKMHTASRKNGFEKLWQPISPLLAAPDFTYANLEGTFDTNAKDRASHGNRMIYDPALATALAASGVDIMSTANNHTLDNGAEGVATTLDLLDKAGLRHAGTRRDANEPWFTLTDVRGFHIAWVACTEWTNERSGRSRVLRCHRDKEALLWLVRELSQRKDVDVVIVTPHGGAEKLPRADMVTRQLQRDLVDAGALLVIGNHPHNLLQWEKRTTPDGREAFVSSCTGAAFTRLKNAADYRTGAFLVVGIARGEDGKVRVRGARHVPLEWSRTDGIELMKAAASSPTGERVRRRVYASMSSWNESAPNAPFDVVPQCREGFVDPGKALGRDGEGCDNDTQCEAGLRCDRRPRDGTCVAPVR